jgi:hypothetical protein
VANDGAGLTLDAAALARDGDRLVRRHLAAGTSAVASTTRRLEQRLEAATQSAVPGRLWRAWQSSTFPKSGPARNPSGTIWIKGGARTRAVIAFWTTPGTIRGREGQYLAIPLPAAGNKPGTGRGRDARPTPVEWEALHNQELTFVQRPGRAALLVAENAVLSGRKQIAKPNTQRRIDAGRGSATIPIFVLLPVVQFRNAFSIGPMITASEGEIAREFFAAIRGTAAGRG